MSKHKFTASKEGSAAYFEALNKYMKCKVLHPQKGFRCKHEKSCKESCRPEQDFYPGQLHHVGKYYDLKRNGKPFRIVISGAEYGVAVKSVSVENRTDEINCLIPDKNQHMMGTLFLLQILLGESVKENDNSLSYAKINGEEIPFFQAFSLANFLLCSAVKNGKMQDAYTPTMQENCEEHYRNMLQILQPQIVVLQGVRSRYFWESNYRKSMTFDPPKIEKIQIEGCENDTLILPLYHPSWWQGKPWYSEECAAVKEYVEPAVENLLKEYEKIHG
ncbi:MAG: hypothetical protein OXU88_00635 [Gammaproteobacteria bacterium]|nr:hypothetical protein [Gammaproteobacteria bacterium]